MFLVKDYDLRLIHGEYNTKQYLINTVVEELTGDLHQFTQTFHVGFCDTIQQLFHVMNDFIVRYQLFFEQLANEPEIEYYC